MSVWFGRRYTLAKNYNYEEYLRVLGIDSTLRKICDTEESTIELAQKNSLYTITTTTDAGSTEIEFRLGQEIKEIVRDGREVKGVFQRDADNFIYRETCKGTLTLITKLQFSVDILVMILNVGNVEALRVYQAKPVRVYASLREALSAINGRSGTRKRVKRMRKKGTTKAVRSEENNGNMEMKEKSSSS